MKKKILAIALIGVLLTAGLVLVACGTTGRVRLNMNPGTYTATAGGYGGDLTVQTVVSANRIESIRVLSHSETAAFFAAAGQRIPTEIVRYQSLDVDNVTGATMTSMAIRTAVMDTIQQAGGDIAALTAPRSRGRGPRPVTLNTGILVVGSGISGLSAAIEAAAAGAEVLVIEKNGFFGGTTAVSGHVIQAARSPSMPADKIASDSPEKFFEFLMTLSRGKTNEAMIRHVANTSLNTVEWLRSMGVRFHANQHVSWPGWEYHRALQLNDPLVMGDGSHMTMLMQRFAESTHNVTFMEDMRALELIQATPGARVTGVIARCRAGGTVTINADTVILATGGFQNNLELVERWHPLVARAGFPPVVFPGSWWMGICSWATGDGHRMGIDAGADTVWRTMPLMGLSGAQPRGVWVTPGGVRFTNECYHYGQGFTARLFERGYHYFWSVWCSNTNPAGGVADAIQAATIPELARAMGLSGAAITALGATISEYNRVLAAGSYRNLDYVMPGFTYNGAVRHQPVMAGPFFASRTTGFNFPGNLAGTRGGLKIDIDGRVLTPAGVPIPGLFAAGEVANGETLPLEYGGSGMALTVYANMARRAGRVAAGTAWTGP